MKEQVNVRVSRATRTKLDWLTERYGTQAEAIAVAVDRLYQQEVNVDGINERVAGLAAVIHAEVCGCDNPRCATRQEIYEWLSEGDGGQGRTVADLVAEWHRQEPAAEYSSAE